MTRGYGCAVGLSNLANRAQSGDLTFIADTKPISNCAFVTIAITVANYYYYYFTITIRITISITIAIT